MDAATKKGILDDLEKMIVEIENSSLSSSSSSAFVSAIKVNLDKAKSAVDGPLSGSPHESRVADLRKRTESLLEKVRRYS